VVEQLPEPQLLAPELLLMRADLVLAHADDRGDAERWYERALRSAGELEAPMLQLRVAIALARFWQREDRVGEAHTLLAEAYARLTEGFATPDLVDARNLLHELELMVADPTD